MAYRAIARKWRPQSFEEVTGQKHITQTLRNAIQLERLHHAYLFSGARGVGKTTTARLFAKALNCHKAEKPTIEPCNTQSENACDSCLEISESRSIDVLEFDAASNTQVQKIRDIILDNIEVAPARDRFKIFIIDEVHMLSTSSFNALLKTIEEPPPSVIFLMATTELHKVPDTIRSRCQEFTFRTISTNEIYDRLKKIAEAEQIKINQDALLAIARSGEGSMRDAQSNFDQVISFSGGEIDSETVVTALGLADSETITQTLEAISNKDNASILSIVEKISNYGLDHRKFVRELLSAIRDILVYKITSQSENLDSNLQPERLATLSGSFSEAALIRIFNSLTTTETMLREAPRPKPVLEIGLLKLSEIGRMTSIESVIAGLKNLSSEISQDGQSQIETALAEKKTLIEKKKQRTADETSSEGEVLAEITNTVTLSSSNPTGQPVSSSSKSENNEDRYETESALNPDLTSTSEAIAEQTAGRHAAKYSSIIDKTQKSRKKKVDIDLEEVINSSQLPPRTSDELAHIEDKVLDRIYELKLEIAGDNLKPILNAEELVATYFTQPVREQRAAAASATSNGSYFNISFESEPNENTEIVIPNDLADESELKKIASMHPFVKKLAKVFSAEITEVKPRM
jgi:DNA polymerase-3 subunit gamma/tau